VIERHVTFHVLPDKCGEFEAFFSEEYRPAMSAMPGFVRVELLRQPDEPAQYQMVIRFESLETAAGWRASAAHQSLAPRIKALYGDSQLQVYEVVA
jgi:antibiotic biosynthesis monooxygenase (ABM) superfamily enzyme